MSFSYRYSIVRIRNSLNIAVLLMFTPFCNIQVIQLIVVPSFSHGGFPPLSDSFLNCKIFRSKPSLIADCLRFFIVVWVCVFRLLRGTSEVKNPGHPSGSIPQSLLYGEIPGVHCHMYWHK